MLVTIETNLNKNNSEEEILVLEVQTHSTGVIYFGLFSRKGLYSFSGTFPGLGLIFHDTKFHHKPFHSQDFKINSSYSLHTFLQHKF